MLIFSLGMQGEKMKSLPNRTSHEKIEIHLKVVPITQCRHQSESVEEHVCFGRIQALSENAGMMFTIFPRKTEERIASRTTYIV